MDYRLHELYSPWNSPGQNTFCFSRGFSNPGVNLGSPALQEDSLPTELSGKPMILYQVMFNVRDITARVLSHLVMADCLGLHGLKPARVLCPWNFPGMNTGVGCHFLLQYNNICPFVSLSTFMYYYELLTPQYFFIYISYKEIKEKHL